MKNEGRDPLREKLSRDIHAATKRGNRTGLPIGSRPAPLKDISGRALASEGDEILLRSKDFLQKCKEKKCLRAAPRLGKRTKRVQGHRGSH